MTSNFWEPFCLIYYFVITVWGDVDCCCWEGVCFSFPGCFIHNGYVAKVGTPHLTHLLLHKSLKREFQDLKASWWEDIKGALVSYLNQFLIALQSQHEEGNFQCYPEAPLYSC